MPPLEANRALRRFFTAVVVLRCWKAIASTLCACVRSCTTNALVLARCVFRARPQTSADDFASRRISMNKAQIKPAHTPNRRCPYFSVLLLPHPCCRSFYSFDVASVHVVVLNPYTATGEGSLQHTWLVEVRQGYGSFLSNLPHRSAFVEGVVAVTPN